jgi:hypothetical protein
VQLLSVVCQQVGAFAFRKAIETLTIHFRVTRVHASLHRQCTCVLLKQIIAAMCPTALLLPLARWLPLA